MKSLKDFLKSFLDNSGHYVFFSFLIAKICGFTGSLLIIRLLPEKDFGIVSIVLSLLTIFLPLTGFGSSQSLLRYGSLASDENEKQKLSAYFFYKGMIFEILLIVLFLGISIFYLNKYNDIFFIFIFCAFRMLGFYFLNHIQTFYRVVGRNKIFAKINNTVNIIGLLLVLVLTYFWNLYGYLIAVALTPYLSLFWLNRKIYRFRKLIPQNYKESWKYGMFAAATSLISDTLFSLDILLLSFLLNENAVANYRVAILIPSNITFLAVSFMQSDFPILSKNYRNKKFLKSYIVNFYKIFIPICLGIFVFFYFFKSDILHLFFGKSYVDNEGLFMILLVGFNLGMLTRNLYGNLLPAVGKIEVNTWVCSISLIVLAIIAYILVPIYGIIGMGIAMSSTILLSGISLLFFFRSYFRKLS